ncbi:MAG: hypothetical protein NZM12_04800, partial [Steroidobacteraceae bacterium]|nr:hypothetical protein [Steroidobacteraceae bacterium]
KRINGKTMPQRDAENFDLDDDFLSDAAEEPADYDKFIDRLDKRTRPAQPTAKRGKAAWSKLEEVLADRRLEKELREVFDDEEL